MRYLAQAFLYTLLSTEWLGTVGMAMFCLLENPGWMTLSWVSIAIGECLVMFRYLEGEARKLWMVTGT